jgi:hypothetical protein
MTDPGIVRRAPASERSRTVALVLNGLLGIFGAHRFYVGKNGTGVAMIVTLGGCGLWWLYDLVLILGGEFRDVEGRRVVHWSPEDAEASGVASGGQFDKVLDEVDGLRREIADLHERMDFAERLLTKANPRGLRGE